MISILSQVIDRTYMRLYCTRTFDLILTSVPSLYSSISSLFPLGSSDQRRNIICRIHPPQPSTFLKTRTATGTVFLTSWLPTSGMTVVLLQKSPRRFSNLLTFCPERWVFLSRTFRKQASPNPPSSLIIHVTLYSWNAQHFTARATRPRLPSPLRAN